MDIWIFFYNFILKNGIVSETNTLVQDRLTTEKQD